MDDTNKAEAQTTDSGFPELLERSSAKEFLIPAVCLYADDIEELEKRLRRHCEWVNYRTIDYEFADARAIRRLRAPVHRLEIDAGGYATIMLEPKRCSIMAGRDTTDLALVQEATDELKKHRRLLSGSRKYLGLALFTMPVGLAIGAIDLATGGLLHSPLFTATIATVIMLVVAYLSLFLLAKLDRPLVVPTDRAARPGFFSRKKDSLLLIVIGGALGVVGTLVSQVVGRLL